MGCSRASSSSSSRVHQWGCTWQGVAWADASDARVGAVRLCGWWCNSTSRCVQPHLPPGGSQVAPRVKLQQEAARPEGRGRREREQQEKNNKHVGATTTIHHRCGQVHTAGAQEQCSMWLHDCRLSPLSVCAAIKAYLCVCVCSHPLLPSSASSHHTSVCIAMMLAGCGWSPTACTNITRPPGSTAGASWLSVNSWIS